MGRPEAVGSKKRANEEEAPSNDTSAGLPTALPLRIVAVQTKNKGIFGGFHGPQGGKALPRNLGQIWLELPSAPVNFGGGHQNATTTRAKSNTAAQ
jgi:hypothetical protein